MNMAVSVLPDTYGVKCKKTVSACCLVFLLVVHYFGFSGLIINGIIGWKKEEKGTRYPSECHPVSYTHLPFYSVG